jgi:hypothetical protein
MLRSLRKTNNLDALILVMGVETQKNPSALIHNMMLFQLIDNDMLIGGKLSIKEAFACDEDPSVECMKGGLAPYTVPHACMASRYMNLYYSHLLGHWYSYDLSENDVEGKIFQSVMSPYSEVNRASGRGEVRIGEMMQREYELASKWLFMKKFKDSKARHVRTVRDLFEYVMAKTNSFYDLLRGSAAASSSSSSSSSNINAQKELATV